MEYLRDSEDLSLVEELTRAAELLPISFSLESLVGGEKTKVENKQDLNKYSSDLSNPTKVLLTLQELRSSAWRKHFNERTPENYFNFKAIDNGVKLKLRSRRQLEEYVKQLIWENFRTRFSAVATQSNIPHAEYAGVKGAILELIRVCDDQCLDDDMDSLGFSDSDDDDIVVTINS